jgi:hypothetical protein
MAAQTQTFFIFFQILLVPIAISLVDYYHALLRSYLWQHHTTDGLVSPYVHQIDQLSTQISYHLRVITQIPEAESEAAKRTLRRIERICYL